ncbi:MAG: hypothetical protein II697_04680 [Clostridia bacterium]|nr:hypothetical protein [Clostridia bacterium]
MDFIMRNGKRYRIVDGKAYAITLLESSARSFPARKSECVLARPAIEGEEILTYIQNGQLEAPEIGQAGCWHLTRCDGEGRPHVDAFGHKNVWQVDDATFRKKYDWEHMRPSDGFTRPRGGVQRFVRVSEDIALPKPWGENGSTVYQTLDANGYLNVTDLEDVYGVAEAEFSALYERA